MDSGLGERLGNIYLTEKEGGQEFTPEDEETLVMFASQAALTVSNARRFRDEQQVRADLEALVNTSPVGILIFDAKTGDLVSLNQETRRIVRGLHVPGHSLPPSIPPRRTSSSGSSTSRLTICAALSTTFST